MKLRDLYKVETLDNRFTPSTPEPLAKARPSLWRTSEFMVYLLFFLTIPILMFKSVYDVSQPSHPTYKQYEHLLEPGWIPGRKVDNSDAQYRGFRENLPVMAVILVLHPLLRRAWENVSGSGAGGEASSNGSLRGNGAVEQRAEARLRSRTRFDLAFAAIFLLALHGVSALKVLLLLSINYKIATGLPMQYVTIATWTFNIGILFANELCRGYPLAGVPSLILPSTTSNADPKAETEMGWGAWLDSYGGLLPRWEVLFNITVLKMIAFNFDYLWSLDRRASSPVEKKNLTPTHFTEKDRIKFGAPTTAFTFKHYLAYTLYSPLYLIGPILNFNDYIHQTSHPLPTTASLTRNIAPYALRFAICLLTMELTLHNLYAVAISKASPDWTQYSPFQLSMLGYFNLHIIWLKLLIPWRLFRLWALLDGIDAPENMVRCMSDNYSTTAFWRGWHRSYNMWVTRYIYIPLGGSRVGKPRAVANFLAVFTFVALWHDINMRLLMWGWMVVLFVLPELIASSLFPAKNFVDRPNTYRWLCGVGAVGNILMMMASSLVGFAVGLDGLQGLIDGIVGTMGGRAFLLGACMTLFVGVQVMFEWRETEKRRGIDLKF